MKTIVLGAGIIGMTTAYWLNRQGGAVEVIDRLSMPAGDTSHANTGMISPSQSWPWTQPGLPRRLAKAALGREPQLRVSPLAALAAAGWSMSFFRRCTEAAGRPAFEANLSLSLFSQKCMAEITAESEIAYDRTTAGTLRLYTSAAALRAGQGLAQTLQQAGLTAEILNPDACIAREPALTHLSGRLTGGLLASGDESGDCAAFARGLAGWLADAGVTMRTGTEIRALRPLPQGRIMVETDAGNFETERCIIALGNGSGPLLRPLGLRLPIQPVKGFSLTFDLSPDGPRLGQPIIDEAGAIGLTPMGDRLRAGGFIDFCGDDSKLRPAALAHMKRVVDDLVPDIVAGVDPSSIEPWACLRPLTPDGPPILGATPVPGLFLNTGHGSTGWTMAAGSGRVLADIVAGRTPQIDPAPYSLARFG